MAPAIKDNELFMYFSKPVAKLIGWMMPKAAIIPKGKNTAHSNPKCDKDF